MAGTRGPYGKRSEERVRRNKPENEGRLPVSKGAGHFDFEIPVPPVDHEGNPTWHPIAMGVYESFASSGESYYAQLSDWWVLMLVCEQISREMKPKFVGMGQVFNVDVDQMETKPIRLREPMTGASLGAITKALGALGFTEGDRRRMSIELQRGDAGRVTPEEAAAANVVQLRSRLERGGRLADRETGS